MAITLWKLIRQLRNSKIYDVERGPLLDRESVTDQELSVEEPVIECAGPQRCQCAGCRYREVVKNLNPVGLHGESLSKFIIQKSEEVFNILSVKAKMLAFVSEEGKVYFHCHHAKGEWNMTQHFFMKDYFEHLSDIIENANASRTKRNVVRTF